MTDKYIKKSITSLEIVYIRIRYREDMNISRGWEWFAFISETGELPKIKKRILFYLIIFGLKQMLKAVERTMTNTLKLLITIFQDVQYKHPVNTKRCPDRVGQYLNCKGLS